MSKKLVGVIRVIVEHTEEGDECPHRIIAEYPASKGQQFVGSVQGRTIVGLYGKNLPAELGGNPGAAGQDTPTVSVRAA